MENKQTTIKISDDFTKYPGARYRSDGKFSGEEFYEDHFKVALDKVLKDEQQSLIIDFDGTFGYPSSFISEVFTRFAKEYDADKLIDQKINFKSDDEPLLIKAIKKTIDDATE